MYIPVAEATEGGTPIESKRGLKIAPPPSPKAPEAQPPKNANITSLARICCLSLRSDGARPKPTFCFSACSLLTFFIAKIVRQVQKMMNADKMSQSEELHLSIPIKDSNFLLPLSKFTRTREIRQRKQNACLSHYL